MPTIKRTNDNGQGRADRRQRRTTESIPTLTIRNAQMQQLARASPGQPLAVPCERSWIEIRLVDQDNEPVAGQRYRIRLPDSTVLTGVLDGNGSARCNIINPGMSEVCFPDLDATEWRPA